MADGYGPWAPLSIGEVQDLLAGASFPWWFSGGYALELHLGRSWRVHDDIDVGIRRVDAPALHAHLHDRGLAPVIAAGGALWPWDGRPLDATAQENNVWVRRDGGPWQLDVAVGDGTDDEWIYRRDPSIHRPWGEAVLCGDSGARYLAPELQLLFKSRSARPKDDLDAETVIPSLDQAARSLLRRALPADHPWRALLRDGA